MLDLFEEPDVTIARIDGNHATKRTDAFFELKQRLRSHENYYPAIDRWFSRRVVPGLVNGERLGFVGYHGDRPILAAVLKRGDRTKFCHLSIDDGFQGNQLGRLMFSLMAAEVRGTASEIHFTLPEGLWAREGEFFRSFGFSSASLSSTQYRLFEDELRCSAQWSDVWREVVRGLPALLTHQPLAGFRLHDGVVLSVSETHALRIMSGQKTVEVRRKFSDRWTGKQAGIYAARGGGALTGVVRIEEVVHASPDVIWQQYGTAIGANKEEFDEYALGCDKVYAIRLTDIQSYTAPVPLSQLGYLIGVDLAPPQSYAYFHQCNDWGKALAMAALLHRQR